METVKNIAKGVTGEDSQFEKGQFMCLHLQ